MEGAVGWEGQRGSRVGRCSRVGGAVRWEG